MKELSEFIAVDSNFWNTYEFRKENVTFTGKNRYIHFIAVYMNRLMEPFLRKHPGIKRSLLATYKKLNQDREGYDPMPEKIRNELEKYYRPHNERLAMLIGESSTVPWNMSE
jgi:hypothetical protein